MDPATVLGGFGLGAALVGAARALRSSQRRRRASAFRSVAERAQVDDLQVDRAGTLTGRYGPLGVRVRGDMGFASNSTRLVVSGLWPDLALAKAGGFGWEWQKGTTPSLELGDPKLDGWITLKAPALGGRSLFDAVTRAQVREVLGLEAAVRVEAGELTAEFREPVGGRSPLDEPVLSAVLDLARRLRAPESPLSRLAQISHADPLPAVRERALRTLQELEPWPPETTQALRVALRDASPALRLQAARALGAEGDGTLLALTDGFAVEDALAAEALAALGERCTVGQARAILDRSVVTSRAASATAALAVVARGGASQVATIADVLARASEPIQAAAASALGTVASASATAPLRDALRAPSVTVASAAARALGSFATAAAVPALRDAEKRGGEVGRAARTAVAEIQSRLTGASPGQVSLAGGGGQVSVVDAAAGRVAIDRRE